jgi:hypothetical protein
MRHRTRFVAKLGLSHKLRRLVLKAAEVNKDDERYFWKRRLVDSFNPQKAKFRAGSAATAFQRNMNPDGRKSNSNDDPDRVDPWIQAQLSTDQVRWLKNQEGVTNQAELLKNALAEWVVRHPEDWFRGTRLSDAIRSAVTEFIDRHKDEFLAVD